MTSSDRAASKGRRMRICRYPVVSSIQLSGKWNVRGPGLGCSTRRLRASHHNQARSINMRWIVHERMMRCWLRPLPSAGISRHCRALALVRRRLEQGWSTIAAVGQNAKDIIIIDEVLRLSIFSSLTTRSSLPSPAR